MSMELCLAENTEKKKLKMVFSVQLQLLFNYHENYTNFDLGKVNKKILEYIVGFCVSKSQ